MIVFKIRGTVRETETGIGLPGLFVKAYDKDLLFDDLLGSTYTQESGHFEIVSEAEDFREFFDVKPDIYLEVLAPDAETSLYTTEEAVRWQAGRLEEFDVRIPRDRLGDLAPRPAVHLLDDNGEERSDFDVGESLTVQVEGVQPETAHDVILVDENGEELLTDALISSRHGVIEPTTIWPQLGLDDPRSAQRFSLEQAQERWRGSELRLEIRSAGRSVLEQVVRFADAFTRPLLLSTDADGVVINGFEAGEQAAIVSGYNLPFRGTVRVFMVARQHDWQSGNSFTPVRLASDRPAYVDINLDGEQHFHTRVARARELRPGAYDFIVRELRYGYEDDEDLVLRDTDLLTRRITGLVVRQEFMASKAVSRGCANALPISGRTVLGAPYFQYADTFQVGEDIYGALDPAALDPNHQSKMVALYVIQHKAPGTWTSDRSLAHLTQLGGNPAVQKFKTQTSCINANKRLLWPNATSVGEYDIVADFGNNTPDVSTFATDANFDQPLDLIDGYFVAGFRVVPDPTTDTTFANHGGFEYTEATVFQGTPLGSKMVIDDFGVSWSVPLRAVVRFPADVPGATTPTQISAVQANYPLAVIVHGNGHNYHGYNYLLEHWAKNGFIAASIHLNTGMHGSARARILFEHLTIIKAMFGTKAANNIGIMGHSRGGEGVVIAARLNNQLGVGHGINAIISLAPTNQYTDETLGPPWATPYLVVYGAMDGDVDGSSGTFALGNSGFALYDKANGQSKSMVFVYGATHDRFTTIGTEVDVSWLGPTDLPKLINVDAHQKIAKSYMTAFFRWRLKGESQWQGIFRGEWVPAEVAQADGGKVKLYTQYGDTATDVIDTFEGAHTPTSWQVSSMGGSVDDGGTLPVDPIEDELYDADAHSPHETSGLVLRWDGTSDRLEFSMGTQNVSGFAALSFRVTQKVDSPSNPIDQLQDMYVTLRDAALKSRAIKVGKFAEIPYPQKRYDNSLTKSAMRTVRIPLHVFTIEVIGTNRVDLQNVTTLSFEFMANPTGEIEVDSVEFTN